MSALIGALRVTLGMDTAKFDSDAQKAKRTASSTAGYIKTSFAGVGVSLRESMAGVIAGLSVGLFASLIKKSLEYAGSLAETAQQVGATARELQVLRFAAGQVGVSHAVSKGLADQIQNAGTSGKAFLILADHLGKVGDRSQRAAVEVAAMGRAGSGLDNLLSGGSEALNKLSEAAEQLGIVLSDEQIAKADETADRLEALKTVLSANIAGIVSDNANAILALANALATLVSWIGQSIDGWRIMMHEFKAIGSVLAWMPGDPTTRYTQEMNSAEAIRQHGIAYGVGSVTTKLPTARFVTPKTGSDIGKFLAPKAGGGGGKKAREDHSAEQALRESFQFDQDLRRSKLDVLSAQKDLARDYVERTSISIQTLNAEKESFEAELNYKVALNGLTKGKDGLTQSQADQLRNQNDITDSLKRQKVLQDEQEQRQSDVQDLTEHDFDRRKDILSSQEQLAETASERRKIELQMLDLAYEAKRQALEHIMATSKDDAAIEDARRDLVNLKTTYGSDRQGVLNQTRGPFEEWAASIPQSAAKINEAFQSIEVDGLNGLSDAISEVIDGTKSLKAAFGDLAKSILSDLIKMTVKMLVFRAVSSIFGSIGGGGFSGSGLNFSSPLSGGALGSFGGDLPKFASGGGFTVLGRGGTDRNILSINGLPMARVSHSERISISRDGVNGGGGVTVYQTIAPNFAGNAATHEDLVRMAAMTKASTMQAIDDKQRRR
jgi:hypothetical protein